MRELHRRVSVDEPENPEIIYYRFQNTLASVQDAMRHFGDTAIPFKEEVARRKLIALLGERECCVTQSEEVTE